MAGGRDAEFDLGRVLVVADDGHWLRDLVGALRDEGFRAMCTTPDDARAAFDAVDPDVLVHGGSVVEDAVAFTTWARLRSPCAIVVVPVDRQEATTVLALEAGADAVLSRRAGTRVLLAFLRALLRRRPARPIPPSRGGPARYAGLELDPDGRVLRFEGAVIALDGREASILGLLLGAAGAVVTRTELTATVQVTPVELEGIMRRVRQRLESVEGWRRISNVRSVGFRLLEAPPDGRLVRSQVR